MGARERERGRDAHSGEDCGTERGRSLLKKICNPVRASIWIHCGKVPIVAVKWNCRAPCSTIDGQGSQGHAQDDNDYNDYNCSSSSDGGDESLSTCSFCQQRGDNTLINNSLPWATPRPQLPHFLLPGPENPSGYAAAAAPALLESLEKNLYKWVGCPLSLANTAGGSGKRWLTGRQSVAIQPSSRLYSNSTTGVLGGREKELGGEVLKHLPCDRRSTKVINVATALLDMAQL